MRFDDHVRQAGERGGDGRRSPPRGPRADRRSCRRCTASCRDRNGIARASTARASAPSAPESPRAACRPRSCSVHRSHIAQRHGHSRPVSSTVAMRARRPSRVALVFDDDALVAPGVVLRAGPAAIEHEAIARDGRRRDRSPMSGIQALEGVAVVALRCARDAAASPRPTSRRAETAAWRRPACRCPSPP